MKKTTITLFSMSMLSAAILSPIAKADTIGLYVGTGQWNLDYSGSISQGVDSIDLTSDLGLSEDGQNTYFAAIEHPFPFIPNFKIQRQSASQTAVSTLERTFDYAGTTFSLNDSITTNLDLSHTDYIAYFEILDNWVSLDLGLNFKHFNGDISLRTSTDSVSDTLDDFLPMLYGRAQFQFPITNFSVDVETSLLLAGGDSLTDIKAAVAYESDIGFGAELGIKRINLDIEDLGDIAADLTFEGYFVNVTYHF